MVQPDLDTAKSTQLLKELEKMGWDPEYPSTEVEEIARVPEMRPDLLTRMDRLGIHFTLLMQELARVWNPKKSDQCPEHIHVMEFVAVLHALKGSGWDVSRMESEDGKDEIRETILDVRKWTKDRLEPSVEEVCRRGFEGEDVILHRDELEPGLTSMFVGSQRGHVNFKGSVKAAIQGMIDAEGRGAFKSMMGGISADIRALHMDHDQVDSALLMIWKRNRGRSLFIVKNGEYVLHPRKFRDALSALVKGVQQVSHKNTSSYSTAGDPRLLAELESKNTESPSDRAEFRELRQALEDLRESHGGDHVRAVAAANFEDLLLKKTSLKDLAAQEGVERQRLGRELRRLKKMIASKLRP